MKIELSPSDNIDKAFSLIREPGTEFVLKNGTYETMGNWYYSDWWTVASGCKVYGNGSRIILNKNAKKDFSGVVRPDRDLNVMWVGSDVHIEDLILDGNESVFRNQDPNQSWFIANGLRSFGKLTAVGVTVENIRGSQSPSGTLSSGVESFGIVSNGSDGGSYIKNCIVQNCPDKSYVSAFTIGHVGTNCSKSYVTDCKVNVGNNNWYGYSSNCNGEISNCEIINGPKIALYNDTLITDNLLVENCVFRNIEKLSSFNIPAGYSEPKRNIRLKDIRVFYKKQDIIHLLELWDQNKDNIKRQLGPVLYQNVTVDHDLSSKLYIAVVGNDIRPITLTGCYFPKPFENMAGNQVSVF